MYGVVYHNELVAVHDDRDVIAKFMNSQSNKNELSVVKIKKKLKDDPILSDIYLVRYHDSYVPYNLYDTMKDMSDEYTSDYKFCIDILYRLLEEKDDLKPKEVKSLMKVISILNDEIDEDVVSDLKTLRDIKEMDLMFKERVGKNE